jgi:ubiquinol-cytochrome c reductase iron-sulfur subunit
MHGEGLVRTGAPSVVTLPDARRRELLRHTAEAMGGIGLIAATYPLVAGLEPSERARAAGQPVQASWATLQAGELRSVAWRGKPVWLLRRSAAMIASLRTFNADLADPASQRSDQPSSCRNATRSLDPELFVAVGICTHLGCSPVLRLDNDELNASVHGVGGFLCPCHGSRFDLAGRVVRNVPAPTNLEVPPYAL